LRLPSTEIVEFKYGENDDFKSMITSLHIKYVKFVHIQEKKEFSKENFDTKLIDIFGKEGATLVAIQNSYQFDSGYFFGFLGLTLFSITGYFFYKKYSKK
jgi:hypothetical protein